jgi:hypothetical protein
MHGLNRPGEFSRCNSTEGLLLSKCRSSHLIAQVRGSRPNLEEIGLGRRVNCGHPDDFAKHFQKLIRFSGPSHVSAMK